MSLSLNKELLQEFSNNRAFVETGTHTGGGVQIALDCGFEIIRSIEIDENFYLSATKTFSGIDKIKIYHGDSSKMLGEMIQDIIEPITFMLDAHLASGSMLGDIEVPLLKELYMINLHPINTHTILIDDRRGFGYNPNIDPHLSKEWLEVTEQVLLKCLKSINPDYEISYRDTNNAKDDLLVARIR